MRIPSASTAATASAAIQHFIFGYGSLISSNSRAVTIPEHADSVVTPVVVEGLERVWSKRTSHGMTAMGVSFADDETNKNAECVGVLLPVSETDLVRFDAREKGYDRVRLDLEQVHPVSFLNMEEHYKEPDHEIFLDAKEELNKNALLNNNSSGRSSANSSTTGETEESSDEWDTDDEQEDETAYTPSVNIWVYVPQKPMVPTVDHPIAQTYVDTIIRGCLEISEEFAAEFLETTAGWHPEEAAHEDSTAQHDDVIPDQIPLINDRHNPIYIRGDPIWSRQQASILDRLMHKHRPDLLPQRRSCKKNLRKKTKRHHYYRHNNNNNNNKDATAARTNNTMTKTITKRNEDAPTLRVEQ